MLALKTDNFDPEIKSNYLEIFNVLIKRKPPTTITGCAIAAIFRLPTVDFNQVSKVYDNIDSFDPNYSWNLNYLRTFNVNSQKVVPKIQLSSLPYPNFKSPKIPITLNSQDVLIENTDNQPNTIFEREFFGQPVLHKYNGNLVKYIMMNLNSMRETTQEQQVLLEMLNARTPKEQYELILASISDAPYVIDGIEIEIPRFPVSIDPRELTVPMKPQQTRILTKQQLFRDMKNPGQHVLVPQSLIEELQNICSYAALNTAIQESRLNYAQLLGLLGHENQQIKALASLINRVKFGDSIYIGDEFVKLPSASALVAFILGSPECSTKMSMPISVDCINTARAYALIQDIVKASYNDLQANIYCSAFRIPACMFRTLNRLCVADAEKYVLYTFYLLSGGGLVVDKKRGALKPEFGNSSYHHSSFGSYTASETNITAKYPEFTRSVTTFPKYEKEQLLLMPIEIHAIVNTCVKNNCEFVTTFTGIPDIRISELELTGMCDLDMLEIAHFAVGVSSLPKI